MNINVCGVGTEEGNWLDESGFLNADKYIQDSYYYQEYSYEIQVEKSLDKYVDVVKQVMHPVGNRMFGKPLIIDTGGVQLTFQNDSVTTNNDIQQNETNIYEYIVADEIRNIIWYVYYDPVINNWRHVANDFPIIYEPIYNT
jgi:hypothetical protein